MSKPATAQDAELVLKLFDLRREAELRKARSWLGGEFWPNTYDDLLKEVGQMGSDHNRYFRMVIGYWEQACALLNYGLLHEGLFFETSGEFYIVWDKLKKVLPEFRQKFGDKHMLENLEKAAERYEAWAERRSPGSIEKMRKMMNQPRPQTAKAANR